MKYQIKGNDFQTLQVTLGPGESMFSEQGSLFYADHGIEFQASMTTDKRKGAIARIGSAVKGYISRSMNSEDGFMIEYINKTNQDRSLNLSPGNMGGHVIDIDLTEHKFIKAFNGAYFAAIGNVNIEMGLNRSMTNSLLTSSRMITQTITGDGHAFLGACGDVVAKYITKEESGIIVDSRCLVAYSDSIEVETRMPSGIISGYLNKTESMFFTHLKGDGIAIFQSSPPILKR